MTPVTPQPVALGARAHHDRHSPGQQPNIEALLAWQSRSGNRFVAAAADADEVAPAAGLQPAPQPGVVYPFHPAALAWRAPAAGAGTTELGSLQLWEALPHDVEWLDLTLSVHRGGQWWRLHPELPDEPDTAGPDPPRSSIALAGEELAALAAAGIGLAALRAAAARSGDACWVCRLDGLGAFVAGLVDLGWPAA
jgi:hypothetical protein